MTAVRTTQHIVETLVKPDNAKVRTTQHIVETLVKPTSAKVRLTQFFVEVLVTIPATPTGPTCGPVIQMMG